VPGLFAQQSLTDYSFLSFVEQPLFPPKKERRAKAKSEARLDRMDKINVLFDVKPGI